MTIFDILQSILPAFASFGRKKLCKRSDYSTILSSWALPSKNPSLFDKKMHFLRGVFWQADLRPAPADSGKAVFMCKTEVSVKSSIGLLLF